MFQIDLKKRSDSKYYLVAVVIVYIGSLTLRIKSPLFLDGLQDVSVIFGIIAAVLLIKSFETNIFKGRASAQDLFQWLIYFLISIVIALIIIWIVFTLYNVFYPIDATNPTEYDVNRYAIPFFLISFLLTFFIFQLIQFYVKRFQDMNISGRYFILTLIPFLHFYVGYKIFTKGKKTLGILVFISFALSYLIIPFLNGNKGANYFGFSQKLIKKYKANKAQIEKSKALSEDEKEKLINELTEFYAKLEIESLEEFKNEELNYFLSKELFDINNYTGSNQPEAMKDSKELLENRFKKFFTDRIERYMEKHYVVSEWNK